MRELRSFHRDDTCSQGQLAIAMEWDEDEVSWSQPRFPLEAPEMSGKAEMQDTGMGGQKSSRGARSSRTVPREP